MSSSPIVECVPNFSEGRDRAVIDQIAQALGSVEGARVLDVDPGAATHRTVMTVVGDPEAVLEAAFRGIRTAQTLIDMRHHSGEHARMGATDVCPFIPVAGITMAECARLAERLGQRVGEELGIPVYLYESAARSPERQNLANIRAGEYEGLAEKIQKPEWKPDFGPATFNPTAGATVIGARKFLIAYNVNLNSRAKKIAVEVAYEIREQGRNLRGPDGKFVRDQHGEPIMRPGRLRNCKAVGWVIEEYARAQVSMNLTDYEVTNIHDAFDACDDEARKIGARVTGSELVGLVPLAALKAAGLHYLRRQGLSTALPESRIIEVAVQSLGLSELSPFDPEDKIIEYRLRGQGGALVAMTLTEFADELSSESTAPGGGSVGALVGSLAAGLTSMVANVTVGKKGMDDAFARAEDLGVRAQALKEWFLTAVDADTDAFNGLMNAFRLPQDSPTQKQERIAAIESAQWIAIEIPRGVVAKALEALELAAEILEIGNPNAASDAACGVLCAATCAECAANNVLINLKDMEVSPRVTAIREEALKSIETARARSIAVGDRFRALMA